MKIYYWKHQKKKIKKKHKPQKGIDQDVIEDKSLQILGVDEIEKLENVKKIGRGIIFEVI